MFCNHCGQPVPDGSDFCPCCGAILEPSERPPAQFRDRASSQERPGARSEARYGDPYPRRTAQSGHRYGRSAPRPRRASAPIDRRQLWIERDDGIGTIMRHFHAQDHARWKTIAMGGAIVCALALLLPWYTISFLGGFQVLDFLNIFGDGVRSTDWLVIAIACAAIVATLYLGHPMWSLIGCVFLDYFVLSNLTSLFWTFGFMHLTLGFVIYAIAAVVTTYGCLSAGGLEELNLTLPGPAPQSGFTYPDPTDPHIPRGDLY